jgi:hypothetical protein
MDDAAQQHRCRNRCPSTVDLRCHNTGLNRQECSINTTRATSPPAGRSQWCSKASIATLSVDLVASHLGIFTPAR